MIFARKMRDIVPSASPRYLLHKHLSDYQESRPLKNVHGSEVTKDGGICARMYALADLTGGQVPPEWLTTSQAVTFELGHMLEARIIHWFADIGVARTNWRCTACGFTAQLCVRPDDCEKCGNAAFAPENYRFMSKKTGVSCGIDCFLAMPGMDLLKILEIKTIDKEEFKELKAPIAEHRIRTNLYMRSIAESADPAHLGIDTSLATILYTTKGGFGCKDEVIKTWGLHDAFSPFREYEVKRKDADTEDMLTPAKRLLMFRQGLLGMPGPICSTALTARAKDCPFRKDCFNGKFPEGMPNAKK
jgi:hypothetical protein